MSLTEGQNDEQIKDLFTGNTSFFSVPRYQRKYVWGEKNWRQLFEDIEYSIENENWSHFIGTFVFQKNEISAQNTEYIIIDGQQRILTIQLLFMAIISVLQNIQTINQDEEEEKNRYIEIVKDLIMRKPPKHYRLERVTIDYDENYYKISEMVISGQNNEYVLNNEKKSNILACFVFYYDILKQKKFADLVKYYEKLISTKYVGFNSYTEEYAYNIFETLNARGTQLKQMELMKNYLFHYLEPKDNIDNYKKYWLEKEELLFCNNLDCDDFLYHLFKCKYKVYGIKMENLYDKIKVQISNDSEAINSLYDDVIECVPFYVNVCNYEDQNKDVVFILKYFKIKNNKQFRSVLMALLYKRKQETLKEKVFLEVLEQLRNFLIIFNIRHITANKIDKDVHDLAFRIFESNCERDIKYYVYQFLLKDRSFFSFENIIEEIKLLRYSNNKRYSSSTSRMFIYLFEMLNKDEYADYSYLDTYKDWSMEHVINDSNDEEYVSSLGNLLLLTKILNGKCGSKSFQEKRRMYLTSGYSWIKDYANNQKKEPSEEDINRRTEKIAKKLSYLLNFDIETMRTFYDDTKKVNEFLDKLSKNAKRNKKYIEEFKNDDYDTIKGKIQYMYQSNELAELLK